MIYRLYHHPHPRFEHIRRSYKDYKNLVTSLADDIVSSRQRIDIHRYVVFFSALSGRTDTKREFSSNTSVSRGRAEPVVLFRTINVRVSLASRYLLSTNFDDYLLSALSFAHIPHRKWHPRKTTIMRPIRHRARITTHPPMLHKATINSSNEILRRPITIRAQLDESVAMDPVPNPYIAPHEQ